MNLICFHIYIMAPKIYRSRCFKRNTESCNKLKDYCKVTRGKTRKSFCRTKYNRKRRSSTKKKSRSKSASRKTRSGRAY